MTWNKVYEQIVKSDVDHLAGENPTRRAADEICKDTSWFTQYLPACKKKLDVIHFNDAYNIEEKEVKKDEKNPIVGGASRFIYALNKYGAKDRLVLFSGDLFFPSRMSAFYGGEQIIKPFNLMNVDVSCLGNHELDNGPEVAKDLIYKTSSPWVMSNIVSQKDDMKPILGLKPYHVIKNQGFRIGVIGFGEEDWLGALNPANDIDDIKYLDYNEVL